VLVDKYLQTESSTRFEESVSRLLGKTRAHPVVDRPVVLAGSGRCGSMLLQSILNTHSNFLMNLLAFSFR